MNEIARLGQPFALVLDDAHVVTNSQIHEDLVFLVDYLPPQMRLVVSSRADPPWPLARLRAGSDLSELRAGSLRFTREETAAFLRAAELHLTAEDVARLEQRTEGWIAGLKMAAFSMRGRQDVSGFIRTLSGTHRFILDYLVEEVLDLQPDSVWTFLLKSSILERMTASLCDAVTERTDGRAILARLEQDNLFLVPLDDERCWYRYHHLFADLLRSRLQQAHPDKVTALHRRASRWYEQEGLVAEAISHAVEAGDPEWLANLVEENALTMMGHGQLSTVVGWLDAVPEGMVRSRPWLSVARAWALLYTGQMNAVAPVLHKARQSAQHLEDRSRRAHVEGHIAAIQAEAAYVRGEMQSTKALSRKALASLPADDRAARSFAAAHLAYALYWDGDLAAADEALADAHRLARAAGETYVAVTILCDRATVQLDRGQLRQVKGTIERALRFSDEYSGRGGQQPPSSGHAHTYMARVLYEWNDLARALWHARAGNELCRLWQQPETLATSNYTLARVLLASGDLGGALDLMAEAGRLATDLSPWIVERIASWEARIRLAGGDLAAADRWRRESGLRSDDEPALRRRFLYRTLARVLVTLGREQSDGPFLDQASGLLSRLSEAAQAAGATGSEIEFLILRALALQA
ncbi:MAG: helix-turn-helix transcriptional regulator, partial [Anaerolineae bacterium]